MSKNSCIEGIQCINYAIPSSLDSISQKVVLPTPWIPPKKIIVYDSSHHEHLNDYSL